jgi:hypothetical protein
MVASRVVRALVLALAASCAPTALPETADGAAPGPAPSLGGIPRLDPLASDAALGVRAGGVFGGCQGGPESACHALGEGGTHLKLGMAGDLVGVPSTERPSLNRVAPGDALGSYLYLKVLGDGGIDGGRMPLDGPFDPRLAPFLASWIEAGAPSP